MVITPVPVNYTSDALACGFTWAENNTGLLSVVYTRDPSILPDFSQDGITYKTATTGYTGTAIGYITGYIVGVDMTVTGRGV